LGWTGKTESEVGELAVERERRKSLNTKTSSGEKGAGGKVKDGRGKWE